jgi:hypothetical protein
MAVKASIYLDDIDYMILNEGMAIVEDSLSLLAIKV